MERWEFIKIVSHLVGRLARRQGDRMKRWLLGYGLLRRTQQCMIVRQQVRVKLGQRLAEASAPVLRDERLSFGREHEG
jgi:hypothetical protein